MSTADESVDWRQLREFADVELTESYILSWSVEGDSLVVDVDLTLAPEHPFYEKPRPAEKICIRPAVIEFPHCESVQTDGLTVEEPLSDVAARIGLGAITGLRRMDEGPFELSGDFGTVRIDAERPILKLRAP